ncbi:LexA family protein [Xanthobacter tagetidis]|uniref:LexA repressor DNA-binding domain-containing protein n=1 Tax=Xanthobacter tagetidis TaxID=60216 RepID=A0A3L7AH68_9HYPH|nr:hypothetical protein [Xanthobacter tagetidis]MBB6306250.1 SOS-response transcriptional repressor LexA [Xanthobacter tagetidis]RLP79527.1 hypothetical protein D9R14_07645 [Xanthobacter tagetidis]
MTAPMTSRQKTVLDFIRSHVERKGFSPTYAEIAAAVGIKSKGGVARMVECLVERGAIRVLTNRARGIALVEPGLHLLLQPDVERCLQDFARRNGIAPETAAAEAIRHYVGAA